MYMVRTACDNSSSINTTATLQEQHNTHISQHAILYLIILYNNSCSYKSFDKFQHTLLIMMKKSK